MPMTMEAIVKDVEARSISNGTKTIYDVVIQDDSKWTAWEKELAEQAWNLRGTLALLQVDVKQNGNFTNRTLKSIAAKVDAGFAPALSAMEQSIGRSFTEPYVDSSPGPQIQFSEAPQEGSGTPKDTSIWRQVAAKVSAQLMPQDKAEFWDNVATLYRYFETGIIPGQLLQELSAGTMEQAQATDPMSSVSFAEATGTAPDDDIPF